MAIDNNSLGGGSNKKPVIKPPAWSQPTRNNGRGTGNSNMNQNRKGVLQYNAPIGPTMNGILPSSSILNAPKPALNYPKPNFPVFNNTVGNQIFPALNTGGSNPKPPTWLQQAQAQAQAANGHNPNANQTLNQTLGLQAGGNPFAQVLPPSNVKPPKNKNKDNRSFNQTMGFEEDTNPFVTTGPTLNQFMGLPEGGNPFIGDLVILPPEEEEEVLNTNPIVVVAPPDYGGGGGGGNPPAYNNGFPAWYNQGLFSWNYRG